jgi:hypothetical protein
MSDIEPTPTDAVNLERLVTHGTFYAKYLRQGFTSRNDKQNDPMVEITGLNGEKYTARVVFNRNKRHDKSSNAVRQHLINNKTSSIPVKVVIIGQPGESGVYLAVGAPTRGPYAASAKNQFELTAAEAANVITGENIYFGRCISRETTQGEARMRMYEFRDGTPKRGWNGFLQNPKGKHTKRILGRGFPQLFADQRVGRDIVSGTSPREAIVPGNYMIVRLQRRSPKGNVIFVEPVVNIMPDDNAFSAFGKPIYTMVEGYHQGALIRNIPITGTRRDNERPEQISGLGHIKRQEGSSEPFFYKPVVILGAAADNGKYVRSANILAVSRTMVLARKVE